jgi:hypothetical protein
LSAVGRAIERAAPLSTHPGDLYLLKANVAFSFTSWAMSRQLFSRRRRPTAASKHACCAPIWIFNTDATGRQAGAGYVAAIEVERLWSGLARLAYFCGKIGNHEDADRLYREAEDELTAKEMRSSGSIFITERPHHEARITSAAFSATM